MPRTTSKPAPGAADAAAQLLDAWRAHNSIQLQLIAKLPARALRAVPAGSRGRDVAGQLAHCHAVRIGWLHYFATGKRPGRGGIERLDALDRKGLKRAFTASGEAVAQFVARALRGEAKVRMHGKSPVRWVCYLIAHESHHRGSILLACRQNELRLPEDVAIGVLWGTWIFGR